MKAYEISDFGPDGMRIVERPVPEPGNSEVLVHFRAAALNFRDLMIAEGTYNPRMKLPAVPLSDGAGEVHSAGTGVSKWKTGDRVMPIFAQHWFDGDPTEAIRRTSLGAGAHWDGVLREFGCFHENSLVRVPEHLSWEEAATLPCAAVTAWHATVDSGRSKPGDSVLTLGTGGVSVFALQFAKMSGARVISTSSSDEKLAKLRALGADEVINYVKQPEWDADVRALTDGVGVDHVVEVGGNDTFARSLKAVRFGGRVALIGSLTGGGGLDPVSIFMKSVRLQGIYVGPKRMFEEMNRAITVNKTRPVVDRVFGFREAREAMRYMKSGSHFGKVVISID